MSDPQVSPQKSLRVLILVTGGRDAGAVPRVLSESGLESCPCRSLRELCDEIGEDAGAVMLAEEEVAGHADLELLENRLAEQPIWSDLPVIFLVQRERETPIAADAFLLSGDVTLIERPVRVKTLVAAVQSALRNRQRQYVVRDQLSALAEAQMAITAAKDAALQASEAKSRFLANMTHEMRTPLAANLGMLGLALQMELGEEQRQLLESAERAGNSLLRLISDLLDFARVEAGKLSLQNRPFSVRGCIQSALEMVSVQAQEKGLELVSTVEETVPEQVTGDQGRLRQVLLNLLGNAVKFTAQGHVSLRVMAIRNAEKREFLLFSVEDTGIGISQEDIRRLFRMFWQADPSNTRKFGGTGLGLALSRHLVEEMGGKMWARSEAGQGSTFSFTVPLTEPDEKAPAA